MWRCITIENQQAMDCAQVEEERPRWTEEIEAAFP